MTFRTLSSNTIPEQLCVSLPNVGGLCWVIRRSFDSMGESLNQQKHILVEFLDFSLALSRRRRT